MNYDFDIVTLHRAENYGAALQAYALKTYLCDLGYTVGVYDSKQISAPVTKNLRGSIIRTVERFSGFFNKRQFKEKSEKFKAFAEENFDINRSDSVKAYIAGSDQVWNPIVFNPDFYLDFAPSDSLKASYAASIGVSELPETTTDMYREYLLKFDFISVREGSAKTALQKFLPEKDIRVDLDPTFLLTKRMWENLSRKGANEINGDYILLYILHIPENINSLCKWLKKELNAKLVLIDTNGCLGIKIMHDCVLKNVGPEDFLALIRDAKAIITTSFHGTAFSILFEKEFYSVLNLKFPSRIQNVLNYFGIEPVSSSQNSFKRSNNNFSEIRKKLEQNRENSAKYFKSITESYEQKSNE